MLKVECQKCGKEAECTHHGDTGKGGIDYEDLYVLKCPNCRHQDERTEWVSGPYHGDGKTNCPFCGKCYP